MRKNDRSCTRDNIPNALKYMPSHLIVQLAHPMLTQRVVKLMGGRYASTTTPRDSETISATGHWSGRDRCRFLVFPTQRPEQRRATLVSGFTIWMRLGFYLGAGHLAKDATFAHAAICAPALYLRTGVVVTV